MNRNKVASLESRIDYLEAEFRHLNQMLVRVGFDEGLKTLAETLDEVLDTQNLYGNRSRGI